MKPHLSIVRTEKPEGYFSLSGRAKSALSALNAANTRLQTIGSGSYAATPSLDTAPRLIAEMRRQLSALERSLP
jgi:hypothetical protein